MEKSDFVSPTINNVTPKRQGRRPINTNIKEKKARTPSGQVLSTSVKDIRIFFSNQNIHGGDCESASMLERNQSTVKLFHGSAESAGTSQQTDTYKGDHDEWQLVTGKKTIRAREICPNKHQLSVFDRKSNSAKKKKLLTQTLDDEQNEEGVGSRDEAIL